MVGVSAVTAQSADSNHNTGLSSVYMYGDNPQVSITVGNKVYTVLYAADQVSDRRLVGTPAYKLLPGRQRTVLCRQYQRSAVVLQLN